MTFETVNPSRGLLGLVSRKPVRVRVYPKSDNLSGESAIKGVLMTIVEKMGIEAEIRTEDDVDGNHYVELASEDSGFLIGKHGRTLDAIQFLVNLIVDSRMRKGKRVLLDVESYRKKRHDALIRLAKSVADRVIRSGRPVLLNYMNPYERRIVHLALEEDGRVTTKSEGEGVYKRVRILSTKKGGGGGGGGGQRRGSRNRRNDRPEDRYHEEDGNRQPDGIGNEFSDESGNYYAEEDRNRYPDDDGNRRYDED